MNLLKRPLILAAFGKLIFTFVASVGFASESTSLEAVVIDSPPIAPQSYDRYGGEEIEPFALDRKSKQLNRKNKLKAKRSIAARKRAARNRARRKKAVQRRLASQLPAKKVKKTLNKSVRGR